jgi:SNF2 family DNA or RNA helicase
MAIDEARIHSHYTDTLKTTLDSIKGIFSNTVKTPLQQIAPNVHKKIPLNLGTYKLFSHQRALIEEMRIKENAFRSGSTLKGSDIQLFSRYGILGDPSGTGKTITALSYISYCKQYKVPNISHYLHQTSQTNFFSFTAIPTNLNTNIFVVPVSDMSNLISMLEKQNDLTYKIIKKENQIHNTLESNEFNNLDLIVISSTQYNRFSDICSERGLVFKRCFFENIHNLHLFSANCTVNAQFTWLITHDWFNILYPTINLFDYGGVLDTILNEEYRFASDDFKQFINQQREIISNNSPPIRSLFNRFVNIHPFRHRLIVSTSNDYLRISIDPVEIQNEILQYNHDVVFQKVYSITSATVQNLINKNDIVGALEAVGTNRIKENELINFTRSEEIDDQCPICYDDYEYPTVTGCCKNVFCGGCILKSACSVPNTICPICRQHITTNKLVSVIPEKGIQPGLYKLDALIKYLKQESGLLEPTIQNSVLLYFPSVIHFSKLKEKLKKENIHYELLAGPRSANKTKIDKFNNRRVKFLIVQDESYLNGHYLPNVTNLILYPDINSTKLTVFFLNRIHRLIREDTLTVVTFKVSEELIVDEASDAIDVAGTAPAAVGDININLGDSVVATSHT